MNRLSCIIRRVWFCGCLWLAGVGTCGCAVHHYDKATGTEHVWGFCHVKMAVTPTNEGVRATVKGIQTLGVGLGLGQEDYYLAAGWNNHRWIKVADDSSVRFEWPSSDFFAVRVGTNYPPNWERVTTNRTEKGQP